MTRGLSRDVSHDGLSMEAMPERGAGAKPPVSLDSASDRLRADRPDHACAPGIRFARRPMAHQRGGIHGPKNRVPEMLQLLHLLALAIVTVVCAGITSHRAGITSHRASITSLAATIEVVAPESANASRWASAPQPSRQWRDGAVRPVVDLEAVEADVDDDDLDDDRDAPSDDITSDAALAWGVWFPRQSGRSLRGEAQSDTSHFASGTGLPRGPPV